ncbi:YfgM family protein [Kangiella shandongensis]|uniref:YfgM family protein n=1 Tax=Kangiella shandongensis TaxID=2763258 RepID=UPI001CBEE131|nr:tetratricopeptide repeat protein [Kangiella shandongensis]
MAQYETEEQQVEAIKEFWKENGKAIILGAIIGFGGIFGWDYYKDYKQAQAEIASQQYAEAMQTIEAGSDEQSQFVEKAEAIKQEHSATSYAALAALKLAEIKVSDNNLDAAAEQLRWVVDQGNKTFAPVAQIRLGRVLLAQEKYDETIQLADSVSNEAYKSSALFIKGEALLAKGNNEAAKNAFIEARDASEAAPHPLLALRLSEFGIEK